MHRVADVLPVGAVASLLLPLVIVPSVPAAVEGVPSTAAVASDGVRLGFADGADVLSAWTVVRQEDEEGMTFTPRGSPDRLSPPGPRHTGEASFAQALRQGLGSRGPLLTYVSTVAGDVPDVWIQEYVVVRPGDPTVGSVFPLTCDDVEESHPVISPEGTRVAFAAAGADGTNDIWVVDLPRVAGGNLPAPPAACGTLPRHRVTDDPADDLWPSWSLDGSRIVFSSTRDDPLGDLYDVPVPPRADPGTPTPAPTSSPTPAGLRRLTRTPGVAETQPAVGAVPDRTRPAPVIDGVPLATGEAFVALTTTQFTPRGSVGFLRLPPGELPDEGEGVAVTSAWEGSPVPSAEPSWGPDQHLGANSPEEDLGLLSFTSTQADPYGDVWLAELGGGDVEVPPVVDDDDPVAAVLGVAESHGSWETSGFLGDVASFVVTQRVPGRGITDLVVPEPPGAGTGRRTVVAGSGSNTPEALLDSAGPAYSPDGSRIAFSRLTSSGTGVAGRQIVVVDVDDPGGAGLVIDPSDDAGDLDTDPAWSPDGREIAFVRQFGARDVQLRVAPVDPPADPAGRAVVTWSTEDLSLLLSMNGPSWHPDGEQIAYGRSVRSTPDDANAVAAHRIWVVDLESGETDALRLGTECDGTCPPVAGRSPAWSPAGTHLAVEQDGDIIDLSISTQTGGWPYAAATTPVTGFSVWSGTTPQDNVPTASRAEISAASDPAWSPDGATIAFSGQPAGRPDQRGIYRVTATGAALQTVAQGTGPETEPSWQPYVDLGVSVTATPARIERERTTLLEATVANQGPGLARGVSLTLTLPLGLDFRSLAPSSPLEPSDCDVTGRVVTCAVPTVRQGSAVSFTVTATGVLLGIHRVTARSVVAYGPVVEPDADVASVDVEVVEPPGDAVVVLDPEAQTIELLQRTTVTATVRNTGRGVVTAGTFTVTVPEGLSVTFVTGIGCQVVSATQAHCAIAALPPSGSVQLLVEVEGRALGRHPVEGRVVFLNDDPESGNTDTADVVVVPPPPDLRVDLTADPGEIPVNGTTRLDALVSTGVVTSAPEGVFVTFDLPAGLLVAGATGCEVSSTRQSARCPVEPGLLGVSPVSILVEGVALGRHTVTATVDLDGRDANPFDNTDQVDVVVRPLTANLALVLRGEAPAIAVGESTRLFAVVTNAGPEAADAAVLDLVVPAGLSVRPELPGQCSEVPGGWRCDLGDLDATEAVERAFVATALAPGVHEVTGTAGSATFDDDELDNAAAVEIAVQTGAALGDPDLAVTVTLAQPVAYVGGQPVTAVVTVTNLGTVAAEAVTLSASVPAFTTAVPGAPCAAGLASCALGAVPPGTTTLVAAVLTPTSAGLGAITAAASTLTPEPDLTDNSDTATMRVSAPVLRLLPDVGRPGTVTLAYGEGFPPGVDVTLTWTLGVTTGQRTWTVQADGTLRAPVLVVRRDLLGERHLRATGTGGSTALFGAPEARMLVFPRHAAPPRFLGRG